MDNEDYRKKIELQVLQIIEDGLKSHETNAKRAKEIAAYILDSLHPHMSLEQIHKAVQEFDDHFSELVPIVLEANRERDERIKKAIANHAGNLLKQGKISEAGISLKNATTKEDKLEK
ncbi:hypothetical protein JW766_05380 [Candidatus Dojkabacteria bacterium]|nr:hypothetical protein [Candidatus Dojkabacteria bacterium]